MQCVWPVCDSLQLIEHWDSRLTEEQGLRMLDIIRATLPRRRLASSASAEAKSEIELNISSKKKQVFLMETEAVDGGGADPASADE
jgi:hypothetical protein